MFWQTILRLFMGTSSAISPTSGSFAFEPVPRTGLEEILSYECAMSVTSLVGSGEQSGPLFGEGGLIFTSVEAQDGGKLLILNNGSGIFTVSLASSGVNRLRFELPDREGKSAVHFFLSYLHGGTMRSRYFEFSKVHAPPGQEELDYVTALPLRAENLQPQLDYAIQETLHQTVVALMKGQLKRRQLTQSKVANCEHFSRQSSPLARSLMLNLERFETIAGTASMASQRMPASVANATMAH